MPPPNFCEGTGRREFVRTLLRTSAVAALTGLTGTAIWRAGARTCVVPLACRGCPVFAACDLSKAEEVRRFESTLTPSDAP
jgi:hypothetical protein